MNYPFASKVSQLHKESLPLSSHDETPVTLPYGLYETLIDERLTRLIDLLQQPRTLPKENWTRKRAISFCRDTWLLRFARCSRDYVAKTKF